MSSPPEAKEDPLLTKEEEEKEEEEEEKEEESHSESQPLPPSSEIQEEGGENTTDTSGDGANSAPDNAGEENLSDAGERDSIVAEGGKVLDESEGKDDNIETEGEGETKDGEGEGEEEGETKDTGGEGEGETKDGKGDAKDGEGKGEGETQDAGGKGEGETKDGEEGAGQGEQIKGGGGEVGEAKVGEGEEVKKAGGGGEEAKVGEGDNKGQDVKEIKQDKEIKEDDKGKPKAEDKDKAEKEKADEAVEEEEEEEEEAEEAEAEVKVTSSGKQIKRSTKSVRGPRRKQVQRQKNAIASLRTSTRAPPPVPSRANRSALPSWEFSLPDKGNIELEQTEDGDVAVKIATLAKLVEYITFFNQRFKLMDNHFLIALTTFTTPVQVLDLLISRFNGPVDPEELAAVELRMPKIRSATLSLLKMWLTKWWTSFRADAAFRKKLQGFVNALPSDMKGEMSFLDAPPPHPKTMSTKLGGKINTSTASEILSFPPGAAEEIANQMCLFEQSIHAMVEYTEFLKQQWNKHPAQAKGLALTIKNFNRMSQWFQSDIVKESAPKRRAEVISRLIQVAVHLDTLNNHQGVMQIISALQSSAIQRLKETWKHVPEHWMKQFEAINTKMSPNNNYKVYRELLSTLEAPYIPFLGIFLTDCTFIDDSNPDLIDDRVNFQKVRMISSRVLLYINGGLKKYFFQPLSSDKEIRNMLINAHPWEENDIWRVSKLREESGGRNTSASTINLTGTELVSLDQNMELTARDWRLLVAGADIGDYNSGDVILRRGSSNIFLWRVKQGTVRVQGPNDQVLRIMEENSHFGEMSVFLERANSTGASVVANEDNTQVYKIKSSYVRQLMDMHADIEERFFKQICLTLAKRFSQTSSDLSDKQAIRRSAPKLLLKQGSTLFDREQRVKFGLPQTEVIISSYQCVLKTKGSKKRKGELFITGQYLCFYSKIFAHTVKKVISFCDILNLPNPRKSDLTVLYTKKGKKLKQKEFTIMFESDACPTRLIVELWQKAQTALDIRGDKEKVATGPEPDPKQLSYDDPLEKADWDIILKGAKTISYEDGEVIVSQGECYQRIYHIMEGRVFLWRKEGDAEKTIVGTLDNDSSFGEVSFVTGQPSHLEVVAAGVCTCVIIEGYFMNIIFGIHPKMTSKFYKYVARELAKKIAGGAAH